MIRVCEKINHRWQLESRAYKQGGWLVTCKSPQPRAVSAISGALDFNNRRSGRDKSPVHPRERSAEGLALAPLRAPVFNQRELNLIQKLRRTTIGGPGQRKFGGARARAGPGCTQKLRVCISDCIYLHRLALQFNGASICHLTPCPAPARGARPSHLFNILTHPRMNYLEILLFDVAFFRTLVQLSPRESRNMTIDR